MNLFRKDRLFVPEDAGEVKGRSMIGYSRRSFFGLAAAAMVAAPSVADQLEFVSQHPRIGEIPMGPTIGQVFDNFANSFGFQMSCGDTITFTVKSGLDHLFEVGQVMELNLDGCEPAAARITGTTVSANANEEVSIQIQSEVIPKYHFNQRREAEGRGSQFRDITEIPNRRQTGKA